MAMGLRGKGMLAVYTEAAPRHERDLNEWYNREHIDERINIPGFHRARRYVAVTGGPKYLATYECDRADDLATRRYLHVLANQTPWSERVIGRFTHFHRMTMRVQLDLAHGEGGALTTVRFVPQPAQRRPLLAWLKQALPTAIARPGMVGAAALANDVEIAVAPQRSSGLEPPAAAAEWMVMLEGAHPDATASAARSLFKASALKPFGVARPAVIGTYRFLFGNAR
jgi:hypothetical protein